MKVIITRVRTIIPILYKRKPRILYYLLKDVVIYIYIYKYNSWDYWYRGTISNSIVSEDS